LNFDLLKVQDQDFVVEERKEEVHFTVPSFCALLYENTGYIQDAFIFGFDNTLMYNKYFNI
jgi:hypothetical protein